MTDTYRKESRKDWIASGAAVPNLEQLQFGAIQRIADATELMAKRHQELIDQKASAEKSRDYWRDQHDAMARRVIAARGQITKLKKALAAAKAGAA